MLHSLLVMSCTNSRSLWQGTRVDGWTTYHHIPLKTSPCYVGDYCCTSHFWHYGAPNFDCHWQM